jgi:molybdopterin-dependent oxidoreductase alpha subunit
VRGHSNVQGDRTMGIWERPSEDFLAALQREFGFVPPRAHGFSTIEAIRALHDGRAKLFFAMGGNFAAASPDTAYTEEALARAELAVHVATALNRTHVVAGREAILLPCLARSERDVQHAGEQFVTVEDSMATVHRSRGTLPPASPELRSEVAIVAGVARSALREATVVPWEQLANDYDEIRERIANVVPGCERMNERVREPGGFVLPRPPAERRFATASGKAELRVVPLPKLDVPEGRLLLMTIRSHDQFNTTIYSDDDRHRGISGDRRVLLANAEDLGALGFAAGQRVDVTSHWASASGEERRRLAGLRLVAYDLPRGCVAAYFPEANPLVPIGQFAERSLTPAFKSIVVSLSPSA